MLPLEVRRWLVEDEDVGPQGTGKTPPVFDKQVFAEVVGIVATAIAQASIAGSQGGPRNLQRFRANHPPTFTGGGDPMVADHWFL